MADLAQVKPAVEDARQGKFSSLILKNTFALTHTHAQSF